MAVANPPVQSASPSKGLLARHPLVFYFIIAFAGTWLVWLPLALSEDGTGLLPFSSSLLLATFAFAAFLGPFLSGFVMTGATEGREWLSQDFFKRPQTYSDLGANEVQLLARLRAESGSQVNVPSEEQRRQIYVPLFGSDGDSSANFPVLRNGLMEAAVHFARRKADEPDDPLQRRVLASTSGSS